MLVPGNNPCLQRQQCTYTPLGEPLDVIFEKLVKDNLVWYLQTQPMEPNQTQASWYKDNEYCKFHRVKGHTTLKCMQLKDYVQDLIDRKEIIVGAQPSPNASLMMYQNAFPPHNMNHGKAPVNPPAKPTNVQGKQGDNHNHTSTYLDYGSLIGCISQVEPSVNIINIKGPDAQCAVTTRRAWLNIAAPPVSTQVRPPPA